MSSATDLKTDELAQLDAQILRYRTMADALRSRADITAKALGSIGLTVVTAIGLARVGDLFPLPPGSVSWAWPWSTSWESSYNDALLGLVGAVVGLLFMAFVVITFSARIWRLQRPVTLLPEKRYRWLRGGFGLTDGEERHQKEIQRAILGPSPESYHLRGQLLAAAATRYEAIGGESTHADVARQEAAVITRRVDLANALVGVDVIRGRASRVISDRKAMGLGALFLAGIVMFALGTSYLSGERTDALTIAKACKDAAGVNARTAYCPSSKPAKNPSKKPSKKAAQPPPSVPQFERRILGAVRRLRRELHFIAERGHNDRGGGVLQRSAPTRVGLPATSAMALVMTPSRPVPRR
jgi:hypothetical protein